MTSSNDDCYYFYYSNCAKGDLCQFRHEAAALGSEVVCNLWQEGRCFRQVCKFRHMEIQKDRSNISCYWESQPGGCQKPHCVFKHGSQDSVPSRAPTQPVITMNTQTGFSPQTHQELGQMYEYESQSVSQVNIPAKPDSQVIGPVTPVTPKVEQFVINPFDEETDEESVAGTPVKKPVERQKEVILEGNKVVSLKTPLQRADTEEESIESLGFEIKSLEEIRREKIAKARQSIEDAGSYVSPTTDVNVHQVEPEPKKIKISTSESKADVKVKSLEEIRREKALQSLKEAQKAKAKLGNQNKPVKVPACTSEEQATTRRIVVTTEDKSSPPKRSLKERLGVQLKDRLGPKLAEATEGEERDQSSKVRLNIKDRLGAGGTRKISLVKKTENSANILIKSLTELKKDKTKVSTESQGEINIRSLAGIKRDRQTEKKIRRVVVNDDDTPLPKAAKAPVIVKPKVLSCSSREVSKSAERENKVSSVQKISPRKPREPKMQLYKPPALKRKATEEAEIQVKAEKRQQPEAKKVSKWGAKTFSEIMREKQMKLREHQMQNLDSSSVKPEAKEQKPRRAFSPVKFEVDNNSSVEKRKPSFTPIVFDLSKKETVEEVKVKRMPIKSESDKNAVSKSAKQAKTVISSNNAAVEEDFLPDSPKISLSPTARVLTERVPVMPDTTVIGSETVTMPYKLVAISPPKAPAKKISLSRPAGQSTEKPALRRHSSQSSGPKHAKKPSVSNDKLTDKSEISDLDETDVLDQALEDFLGDDDINVSDTGSADNLLQEMEELLA